MRARTYNAVMAAQLTFGQALRRAIKSAGVTQAAVAEHLITDASQVSRWVNDKAVPLAKTVSVLEEFLNADLAEAFSASTPSHELYVAAPITGLDDAAIAAHHDSIGRIVDAASGHVNSVWWPGSSIHSKSDLRAADLATEQNLRAMEHCQALLYLQFAEIKGPTGALVELGIALGRRMKTTIICLRGVRLPFMMEPTSFAAVAERSKILPAARLYEVESVEAASTLVANNGRELLGLN